MADFMGDDIRLREVAGSPETLIEFAEKREVEIHLLIRGAVEGANLGAPDAAARLGCTAEQHEDWRDICLATLPEHFAPCLFCVAEHDRNEFRLRVVIRHARRADGLILWNAAGADEIERTDACQPRNEQQDYETAHTAAEGQSDARASHSAAILDVSAAGP